MRSGYEKAEFAQWSHFDLQAEVGGGRTDVDDFDELIVIDREPRRGATGC